MDKTNNKYEQLYLEEISLLPEADAEAYIRLNLRRILAHRRQFDIPVIAIAGAEGKTTTKRMVSAILSQHMNLLETPPNCSTAHGVTSALLRLDESHDAALLEIGVIDNKQFKLAVEVAEPSIAAVTNIGEAHLATLGDKYLIADAKTELIRHLPEDGVAVLNIDDDLVSTLGNYAKTPRIIKFGLNTNAHFYASDIHYHGPAGISFKINGYYNIHLPVYSSTSIYNALTAIAIARSLGIDFEDIQHGLEKRFSLLRHRGNLLNEKGVYILDYTYDATVNAVTKELESLIQFKNFAKKLVLVIGDIRYSGPRSRLQHLKIGYIVAASPIDTVITVGKNARQIAEGLEKMNHSQKKNITTLDHPDELKAVLPNHLESDSCVLMMGSRDLALSKMVNQIFAPKSYIKQVV